MFTYKFTDKGNIEFKNSHAKFPLILHAMPIDCWDVRTTERRINDAARYAHRVMPDLSDMDEAQVFETYAIDCGNGLYVLNPEAILALDKKVPSFYPMKHYVAPHNIFGSNGQPTIRKGQTFQCAWDNKNYGWTKVRVVMEDGTKGQWIHGVSVCEIEKIAREYDC